MHAHRPTTPPRLARYQPTNQHLATRLELALVSFFQAFRKMYACELLGGGPSGGIGGPGLLSMSSVRMDAGPVMKQVGGWVIFFLPKEREGREGGTWVR